MRCLDVEPKTGRTLAGTFGYGHNLFCLGPDGKLLWKVFLPEHNVYLARWYDEGRRVVAATGRGYSSSSSTARTARCCASSPRPNGRERTGTKARSRRRCRSRSTPPPPNPDRRPDGPDGRGFRWQAPVVLRPGRGRRRRSRRRPTRARRPRSSAIPSSRATLRSAPTARRSPTASMRSAARPWSCSRITNVWAVPAEDSGRPQRRACWRLAGDTGNKTTPAAGGELAGGVAKRLRPHRRLAAPLGADGKRARYVVLAGRARLRRRAADVQPTSVERRDDAVDVLLHHRQQVSAVYIPGWAVRWTVLGNPRYASILALAASRRGFGRLIFLHHTNGELT